MISVRTKNMSTIILSININLFIFYNLIKVGYFMYLLLLFKVIFSNLRKILLIGILASSSYLDGL